MTGDAEPLLPLGVLVALLSAASGIVDAFAFLAWQVFVANQTGNLVTVAISLVGAGFPDAVIRSIVALLGFVAGVAGAWAVRTRSNRGHAPRGLLLWLQATALLVVAGLVLIGSPPLVLIGTLALTQGIQGVALTRVLDLGVRTVVITGAILDVARLWSGRRRDRALLAATAPLGYATGAIGSAVVHQGSEVAAVLLAVVCLVLAAGLVWRLGRRPGVVA